MNACAIATEILDEIALEGLDGITPQSLFIRLEKRACFPLKIDEYSKRLIWEEYVTKFRNVQFYEVPKERPDIPLNCDKKIEEFVKETEIYPICPVQDDNTFGSCQNFSSRINVTELARSKKLAEAEKAWGRRLVVVANQATRTKALFGDRCDPNGLIESRQSYILLELIGRTRNLGLPTHGPGSAQLVEKDSRTVFYLTKPLLKKGLITKRPVPGSRPRLWIQRFPAVFGIPNNYDAELLSLLLQAPNNTLPIVEICKALPGLKLKMALKRKLCATHLRRTTVLENQLPFSIRKKSKGKSERVIKVNCLQLKNPDEAEKYLSGKSGTKVDCYDNDDDDEAETQAKDITSPDFCLGMPVNEQIFRALLVGPAEGCRVTYILSKVACTYKQCSAVLEKMTRTNLVTRRRILSGKQKLMLYCIQPSELKKPVISALKARLSKASPKETPLDPGPSSALDGIVDEVKEVLNDQTFEKQAERNLMRMGLILRCIKANRFISRYDLQKFIMEEELKEGLAEKIDRRTLARLLNQLDADGLIKLFTWDSKMYCAQPTFNPDDMGSEELSFNTSSLDEVDNHLQKIVTESINELDLFHGGKEKVNPKMISLEESRKYYLAPKFLRLSVLHDLLFYVTRGYSGSSSEGQSKMLQKLERSIDLEADIKSEMPPLYWDRISCYMFIPPFNPLGDKGWCSFIRLVLNMPLSVYLKLVVVKSISENLLPYLEHPIRFHYPLKTLPPSVRAGLVDSKQFTRIFLDVRRLCFIGLARLGARGPSRKMYASPIYINKKASIIDTTSSKPVPLKVESKPYETIEYEFSCTADVKAYWVKLFNVCLETKIGNARNPKETHDREFTKESFILASQPISGSEGPLLDNGAIPGDHLGAGGLDSVMCSFLRVNWVTGKVPVGDKRAKDKNKVLKPSYTALKRPLRKRLKPKKTLKAKQEKDETDREAVKSMQGLRVTWSEREDGILLLCKAACERLSFKCHKPFIIGRSDMREALRRLIGKDAVDKTSFAVMRRIILLSKRRRWRTTLEAVQNSPELQCFVDALPPELEMSSFPNGSVRKDLQAKVRKIFHEMVDFMFNRFFLNGVVIPSQEVNIPDSLEELEELYDIGEEHEIELSLRKIQEDSIRALFLGSLAMRSPGIAAQLLKVYGLFDEPLLRSALKRMNKQKIISNRKSSDGKNPLMTEGHYQFSQRFKYLLQTKYSQSLYHEGICELSKLLSSEAGTACDVNLSNCGPPLFSLLSSSHIKLTAIVPEHFVKFDTKTVPKNLAEKIMQRYEQLLQDPDQAEKKVLEEDDEEEIEIPSKRPLLDVDFLADDIRDEFVMEVDDLSEGPVHAVEEIVEENSEKRLNLTSTRVALMLLREIADSMYDKLKDGHSRRPIDVFVVTASRILCTPLPNLARDYCLLDNKTIGSLVNDILDNHVLSQPANSSEVEADLDELCRQCSDSEQLLLRRIWASVENRELKGMTVKELRAKGKGVATAVQKLEKAKIVLRVGLSETRFISRNYVSSWTVRSLKPYKSSSRKRDCHEMSMADMVINPLSFNMNEVQAVMENDSSLDKERSIPIQVLMRPWIRVDGAVNKRVLDQLLGSVLGHIMTYPGLSVALLAEKFSPALTPVWVRELTDILHRIGAVDMTGAIQCRPTSLFGTCAVRFSDSLSGIETFEEVLVEPTVGAMLKLGQFIGNKSFTKDIFN